MFFGRFPGLSRRHGYRPPFTSGGRGPRSPPNIRDFQPNLQDRHCSVATWYPCTPGVDGVHTASLRRDADPFPTFTKGPIMLKLNAGFSRKVGEPNYGSRGASVNVELEVESGLIGDPDALMTRIRNLFTLAKRSVDAELGAAPSPNGDGRASRDPQPGGRRNHQPSDVRYATSSQVRAIQAICRRQGLDARQVANERFRVNDLEELTVREASSLIDDLKAGNGQPRAGGGR
jgi:hypothetical protein